jgi:hypothetical protein
VETESQVNPYEVRCPACECSFAPGTRYCVHCGGRIGGRLRIPGASVQDGNWEGGEDVEIGSTTFLRWGIWGISVLLAVVLSLLRSCAE